MRRTPPCGALISSGILVLAVVSHGCGGKSAPSKPCDCAGGTSPQTESGATSCDSDDDCEAPRPYCSPDRGGCVECRTGSDCAQGLDCIAGACLGSKACKSSRDCPQPLVCSDARQCVECVSKAECREGQRCLENACRTECESDRDCLPSGLLCDRELERCVECLSGSDCGKGRACLQGRCSVASNASGGGGGAPATPGEAGDGPSFGGRATGSGGSSGGHVAVAAGASPLDAGAANRGAAPSPGPCGNSVIEPDETCDDGNAADGDGCSSTCQLEAGFHCARTDADEAISLPAIYRDFRQGSDFEQGGGGKFEPTTGIVETTLDLDGKPTLLSDENDWRGYIRDRTTFSEWYRDVPGYNSSVAATLPLWKSGDAYASRWGQNGEKWRITRELDCGPVGDEVNGQPCSSQSATSPCEELASSEILSCEQKGEHWYVTRLVAEYDGNPVFFPLDNVEGMVTPRSEYAQAVIPTAWGGNWDAEPSGKDHNFHFTSEIHFRFRFDASRSYRIRIMGDDDLWVFINQTLVIDLGGVHTPVSGDLELNPNGSSSTTVVPTESETDTYQPYLQIAYLGLEDGHQYEVAIFQAERKKRSSSFLLSLTGFELAPSQCMSAL